jgi:hypothetical protein
VTPETREWLYFIEDWSINLGGLFAVLTLVSFGVHILACAAWRWIQ